MKWREKKASPTYRAWMRMRGRVAGYVGCTRGNFRRYVERGIRVCERWNSFENFLADMGERPPGMSLDRINNDGHYEPGNCRWATTTQQNRNRSNTRFVTLRGETKTLAEWAEVTGIPRVRIYHRITQLGWSPERAVFEKIRGAA